MAKIKWHKTMFGNLLEKKIRVEVKKGLEYSFVPMENIDPGRKFPRSIETKMFSGSGSKFCDGDTLFARITPCLENKKVVKVKNLKNGFGFGSTELFVFRAKKNVADSDFVFYLSKLDDLRNTAQLSMTGASGRQRADLKSIHDFLVNIPDLSTQSRIASVLSAYDDLIENNEKCIKVLEEMAQRLYTEWFVKFKFPGHEKACMADSGSEYGMIPEGWEVVKIGNMFCIVLGGTPSRGKKDFWKNGNIAWINSGAVNQLRIIEESELITNEALQKSATKMMPQRTTLLAITGATLGQVSLTEIECCANQSVIGIYDRDGLFNEYLYLKIKEIINNIIALAGGGAQQHINKDIVNNTEILIPNKKIIERFLCKIKPVFDEISFLMFQNRNLKKIRDLLIPQLVTGKKILKYIYE